MPELDTPSREWSALIGLLDQALELSEGHRERWIGALPSEYDTIRPRLRRLLSHSDSTAFLHTIPKVADGTELPVSAGDAPGTIAAYRIERKLSEGGMGTVWLAYRTDVMVNRPVALKLPRWACGSTKLAEWMADEREILAALEHPNIARLYDAGITSSGQPYLALEYVAGCPIDDHVREHRLPLTARLHLFLQVAGAIAHAHRRLVVHRDLKPSNILVTEDGVVKLLDFGIAKLLDRASSTMKVLTELGLGLLDRSKTDEAAASFRQALMLSQRLQSSTAPERRAILQGLVAANAGIERPAPDRVASIAMLQD